MITAYISHDYKSRTLELPMNPYELADQLASIGINAFAASLPITGENIRLSANTDLGDALYTFVLCNGGKDSTLGTLNKVCSYASELNSWRQETVENKIRCLKYRDLEDLLEDIRDMKNEMGMHGMSL